MNKVNELVALLNAGQILEAFDTYYAEDVSMRENTEPPTVGFQANRERELGFLAMIDRVNEFSIKDVVSDGDRAVITSVFDFVAKDGKHFRFDQVSIQRWRDGKIVDERFVYDTAHLVTVPA